MSNSWNLSKLAKIGFGAEIGDIPDRRLEDYGKTVVVSQEEFQKSINPSKLPKNKINESRDQSKSSHFLTQLTAEQRQRLLECFKKYSTQKTIKKPPRSRLNANGVREVVYSQPQTNVTISQQQLGKLFRDAGIPLHNHTLNGIFTQLVKARGADVSFDDVLDLIALEAGSLDKEEDYWQIFQVYDRKNRGYFDFEDYKLVCQGVAKGLTEAEMHHAFRAMDHQGSNRVSYQRFVQVMQGQ